MSQTQQFTKTQYGSESSAYGTEAASYNELPRVQNIEITPTNNIIYSWGLGEGLNASNAYYGSFDASGSVSFNVVDFTFLQHFVGPKAGSGTAGAPYTLTEAEIIATSGATALLPFSIEYLNSDTTTQATVGLGCVGQSFTLSGAIGGELSCSANFICQKSLERESGQTYVAVTTQSYVFLGGTFKWGSTPATLPGVRSFSITMDNGLVTDTYSITSRFRDIPKMGNPGRTYKFTIGIIMAQALGDLIYKSFYGKESPTNTYTPEDGTTSISPETSVEFTLDLVNGSRYATIQLDGCVIDRVGKPMARGGGLVIVTVDGTALKAKDNIPIKWWAI